MSSVLGAALIACREVVERINLKHLLRKRRVRSTWLRLMGKHRTVPHELLDAVLDGFSVL